ncbi:S-phase kinase-associated protein 2-like [Montipora foliosa]|uniref:S-phase kinase-associated protein 2-like n=1 Tax=Montipora foliosa TaxID=591990 RepID=UPI0035F1D246
MASTRRRNRTRNVIKNKSKVNATYKELGVAELQWPAEEERELTQEIVRVNPLKGQSILQASSYKYLVSHWGKTSSLVASLAGDPLLPDHRCGKGEIKKECTDCSVNRQGNNTTRNAGKPSTNYWTLLSDEIILTIFQLLSKKTVVKCARICKHWQRLAYDETLWCCVDMTKANLLPGLLGKVLKRGTKVLRLAQAKVASPLCDDSSSSFLDVAPLSPQSQSDSLFRLQYLDATGCSFENDTLLCLLLHSKQLTHISLESCNVSTSVLKAVSELRHLQVLNLAMCTGVTVTGICSLVKSGKNTRLKQLNLAWTNLTKATILQAVKNMPNLQRLNLSGCRETLRDDCVKQLVKSCPLLTHLDLSDAFSLTAKALEDILKLEKLVHLSLSRCYSIPPAAFSSCSQRKSLKSLEIYGFLNSEGIEVLNKELPHIAVNKSLYSSVARPVGTMYFGKIWEVQCKD